MRRTAKVTVSLLRKQISLAKGYKAMAKKQKQFVTIASKIEHEVLPEWE